MGNLKYHPFVTPRYQGNRKKSPPSGKVINIKEIIQIELYTSNIQKIYTQVFMHKKWVILIHK